MPDPVLLYGIGATKAGTSWLYRYLHDHPDCALRAVKEAHYWDTFNAGARARQVNAFGSRLGELRQGLKAAEAAGHDWRVRNHLRRIDDMERLIALVDAERHGHHRYVAWLLKGTGDARLVADITPGYAALDASDFAAMRDVMPTTRFLYLLRDPVDRLWSHVRMHARRITGPKADPAAKANAILARVLEGREQHIARMSDYSGTWSRLSEAVPEERRMLTFSDDLSGPETLARIAGFLGIAARPGPDERVNESAALEMEESLSPRVAEYLKPQYEWAARTMGTLPARWQDNLRRASA